MLFRSAVSNNFKQQTRTTCNATTSLGATTCLNSDTRGTITIRYGNAGTILHDATNSDPQSSGVIAVVFSPGIPLRRQDGIQQDRGCGADASCVTTNICTNTTTPKCNPINYLDISGTEDNANFSDSTTNGFTRGVISDVLGNIFLNDRLVEITYQDLMPRLEKRIAGEILVCLDSYASVNNGRYPWAAPTADVTTPFASTTNTKFGRIPDQPLTATQLGSVAPTDTLANVLQLACDTALKGNSLPQCMRSSWPTQCLLPVTASSNSWWNNWKLHVFYAVADAYKPATMFTQPTPTTVIVGGVAPVTGCPTCLTLSPSTVENRQVVVLIGGKRLAAVPGGQPRGTPTERQNLANYLEGENSNSDTIFLNQSSNATFNDFAVSLPK